MIFYLTQKFNYLKILRGCFKVLNINFYEDFTTQMNTDGNYMVNKENYYG